MLLEFLEPRSLLSVAPAHAIYHRVVPVAHNAIVTAPQNSSGGVTIYPTARRTFVGTVATFRLDAVPPPIVETDTQISWGDGGNAAGQIAQNPDGSYNVIGTHLYARSGTYALKIEITQGPHCVPGQPCPEFPTRIVQTIGSTAIVAPQPGDADSDGRVDFADLLTLAQHYGNEGSWSTGDFNGDGRVDFADLLLLAQNYGA